jgi:signal transduction histidine kinase/ActR/RegA family two-component response regulator
MSNEGEPQIPSRQRNAPEDRLREANEQLTLKALQSLGQVEESVRRSCDLSATNEVLLIKQQQLRSLVSALTLTEHRERKRLATELHDYLAQMMVLGRLKIGQARARIRAADSVLSRFIDDIDEIFIKSLVYTRTLMAELSPPVLQELGLPLALKWLAEQMLKHGLTVNVRLSHEHVPLRDEQAILLYQAVRELLLNVVKHAETTHAMVSLSVRDDETAEVSVQDQGRGFDPASLEARTAGEHFGLFSIKERLEAMGGWFQVDSALGHGTTVILGLALTRAVDSKPVYASSTTEHESQVIAASNASNGYRILLVDDHAMVRQGLRAILESYSDVSVIAEAANGVEAVSIATDIKPDVILMDVNMPRMDGIEATKQIKANQPSAIVIGLSVNNSTQVMEAMTEAGATAFVSKDAAADQLYAAIVALAPQGCSRADPQSELPFSQA